jgi:CxxC-x17-CxxC domain-containing protein
MKKNVKHQEQEMQIQNEPDLAGQIDSIQKSLAAIERKLDALINRPQERAPQDRPFQRFDRHQQARDNSFRERRLFKVICAECGQECEVPFKPSGDRPVYCKECFSKRKGGGPFREAKFERRHKEGEFTPERHFAKKHSAGDKPGGRKKKSFSRRKK